jgi:TRAP-type C4-dicarboxylate transport system permease small subunit
MINLFSKFLNQVINIVALLSGAFLLILVSIVCLEIIVRFLFDFPIVYTTELTQLFFPWMIFLGAVAVTHRKGHIKINFFNKKLPVKIKSANGFFIQGIMLFFSILVCISSFEFSRRFSSQYMPVLRISMSWLYSSMVVSFGLISIILFYQVILKIFRIDTSNISKTQDSD